MNSLETVWTKLDLRKRIIVGAATIAVFASVLFLARGVGQGDMALLYSGLDPAAAGEVVAALEQQGAAYEVRGPAIYVGSDQRDLLRMTLAGQGLPAASSQGYELLDGLSGFGTTSQMFDAAYWRAKEGELARTIVAAPNVKSARVHISTSSNRPFARELKTTAAVTVATTSGTIDPGHAKALQYLVASAVSGLSPEDVAVIDGQGTLVSGAGATINSTSEDKAEELRTRAERLLAARVGPGNAVVEVSVDAVTESESITERTLNPESRVAISTDTEERTATATDARGQNVTVASNLPAGNGGASDGTSSNENNESRTLTNYEVSETRREILRSPGAIRRLTVAVLVNDAVSVDSSGAAVVTPRSQEELAALRDLVASAVGLDETRGDIITLRSLAFEPVPTLGTEAVAGGELPLNVMALIQLAVLAVVALLLGLFVVRPILMSGRASGTPVLLDDSLPALGTDRSVLSEDAAIRIGPPEDASQLPEPEIDPVTRLRRLIEERQTETIQILQSWIEDPEPVDRT